MRTTNILSGALALILFGCTIGKNAAEAPVATMASGAGANVELRSSNMPAELLDVRDSGIVVLRADGVLAFTPYTAIKNISVPSIGSSYFIGFARPSSLTKYQIAAVSHFPQGMSDAMATKLMAKTGQAGLVTVK